MPAAVTSAFERLRRTVAGFTVAQRTIAIIGIAGVALGVIALTTWLTRPNLTPLFSGLSASDANAVVEQLRSASVPYELADGGATILVPEEDVYDQRLTAAAAGLPSSDSEGYSLLDQVGMTSSEFQQDVAYKRAIEGELASTISAMDGVSTASVQLAIPEESVFVSETVDPTASVFVETSESAPLSTEQVEAIVHLTSASVSGMKAENVAVVDQSGRTLSAVGVGSAGGADQQAGEYERRVSANVQQILDAVVGTGNASVTVVAETDLSQSERLDETYTPVDGAPPATEERRTETRTGGADSGAGVLGPDNIAVPSGDGDGTYESTEETRSNVINKSTESTTTPAGSLTRQSVSVAVDAGAAGKVRVETLNDLVAAAAGIDPDRGDTLSVRLVAFSDTDAETAQAAKDAEAADRDSALLTTLIVAGAIAVPLAALGIALAVRSRRRARSSEEFEELFGEKHATLADYAPAALPTQQLPTVPLSIAEQGAASEPGTVSAPAPDPALEAPPAQASLERRRAELGTLTRRDPRRTAELLRALLDEGQPV